MAKILTIMTTADLVKLNYILNLSKLRSNHALVAMLGRYVCTEL